MRDRTVGRPEEPLEEGPDEDSRWPWAILGGVLLLVLGLGAGATLSRRQGAP